MENGAENRGRDKKTLNRVDHEHFSGVNQIDLDQIRLIYFFQIVAGTCLETFNQIYRKSLKIR